MRSILFSSRNAHKLNEVRTILGPKYEVVGLDVLPDFPEVDETGATFVENAELKALAASLHYPGWVFADDSGLEVDALSGEPGVRSARYAGEKATDADNRRLLIQNLALLSKETKYTARFRCAIAVAEAGKILATFAGAIEGEVLTSERGKGGFGYDPLFVPQGYAETFAELSPEVKNTLSHRGEALSRFRLWAETGK